MPGPGGPGPAEERALTAKIDPRLLEQQVLVVAFPDAAPEVYIVCADQDRRGLLFCEAGVTSGGAVDLGTERLVPLVDIGSVHVDEGALTLVVLGHDHQMLVQMHFEELEPHSVWAQGLRVVIGSSGRNQAISGPQGDDSNESGEMHMLQARSRQLQNKISTLEAVNERRDKQLDKMVKRLDGAMQMLEAVEGMCNQQRNVISAQKTAIVELQHDLGLEAEAEATNEHTRVSPKSPSTRAQASPKASCIGRPAGPDSNGPPEGGGGGAAGGEAEMGKVLELLTQAEQMKQMLQHLTAAGVDIGGNEGSESSGSPSPAPNDLAAGLATLLAELGGVGGLMSKDQEQEEEEDIGDVNGLPLANGGDSEEAALERLQGLEAEKQRFEGLLQDSQKEHQDLLDKLSGMRALMTALGMQEGDLDDLDDATN